MVKNPLNALIEKIISQTNEYLRKIIKLKWFQYGLEYASINQNLPNIFKNNWAFTSSNFRVEGRRVDMIE